MSRVPVEDRFWAKVDKNGPVPPHRPELGQCWEWVAARSEKGYGLFGRFRAHRWLWAHLNGPIPDRTWVLHACDNPPCVGPSHLFLGTAADNTADMMRKGRWNANRALPTGAEHWTHQHPERIRHGDMHHAVLHPEVFLRGEDLPQSRVGEHQVKEIRALKRTGLSDEAISRRYPISRRAVNAIVNRKTWRHV